MPAQVPAQKANTKIDADFLWRGVLGELQVHLNPTGFRMWFASSSAENLTDTSVDIVCNSKHAKHMIEKSYTSLIEESVAKICHKKVKLNFIVRENTRAIKATIATKKRADKKTAEGPLLVQAARKVAPEDYDKAGLSPRYTFENFILGGSNQLAFAIAAAIADNPGKTYNPVFFYSEVGLGKTHLIQAIGNKILQENPHYKIVYTTGEAFTNELIETLQRGKGGKYSAPSFRNKFRKADVFLIDDVQFIAGREATQQEFFHTFNALQHAGKQVVLTSDKPPKDLENLTERITSRFNSGIIADIQMPDTEMRNAILRSRRDSAGDVISNEVIDFIAQKVATNTRELEGAYLRIVAVAKTMGGEPTIELAGQILGKTVQDEVQRKNINVSQVLKAVCDYYSVKGVDVKGPRRNKELVVPRQIAMFLLKDITRMSFVSIGEVLGGRDHSTIMYGVDKVRAVMTEVVKVRQDVANIKQTIYR